MNRTQNSPKRRQQKQLSARRKHWNHMQVTDRPSPDTPSLTQAMIVQMPLYLGERCANPRGCECRKQTWCEEKQAGPENPSHFAIFKIATIDQQFKFRERVLRTNALATVPWKFCFLKCDSDLKQLFRSHELSQTRTECSSCSCRQSDWKLKKKGTKKEFVC